MIHANLGAALATACSYSWNGRRMAEASTAMRTAIEFVALEDARRASFLSNLCGVLEMRYERLPRRAYLDEAISVGYLAAEAPGNDPVEQRGNLANALLMRYRHTGSTDDLTAALEQYRLITARLDDGHPHAAAVLGRMGDARALAFQTGLDPQGLSHAVDLHRRAVAAAGPGDRGTAAKLATSLRMRYEATGDGGDLDEMVRLAGEGAADESTLATCLLARFERTGDVADIDAAVWAARDAAGAGPRRAPQRRRRLANLAEILRVRAQVTGCEADLDDAYEAATRALTCARRSDPDRPAYQINLANVLVARYRRHGLRADLDRAVERTADAVLRSSDADPALPERLSNLAELLRIRYEDRGDAHDGHTAVNLARRSTAARLGPRGRRRRVAARRRASSRAIARNRPGSRARTCPPDQSRTRPPRRDPTRPGCGASAAGTGARRLQRRDGSDDRNGSSAPS